MRTLSLFSLLLATIVSATGAAATTPVHARRVSAAATDLDRAVELARFQARRSYFVPIGEVDETPPRLLGVVDARRLRFQRVAAEPMPGQARYAELVVQILDMRSADHARDLVERMDRTALTGAFADGARVFLVSTDAPEFHHHVSSTMARLQQTLDPVMNRGVPEGLA